MSATDVNCKGEQDQPLPRGQRTLYQVSKMPEDTALKDPNSLYQEVTLPHTVTFTQLLFGKKLEN